MKRTLIALVVVVICATAALAGGDQNQGSKGQGTVVQNQVRK